MELTPGGELPFADARFAFFAGIRQPECALLVGRGDGILMTCDAIQHYGDYSRNSLLARIAMPFMGFPRTTLVGPIWLKYLTRDRAALERSFRALLELPFDSLLSAHGTFLERDAKAAVAAAIERAFRDDA